MYKLSKGGIGETTLFAFEEDVINLTCNSLTKFQLMTKLHVYLILNNLKGSIILSMGPNLFLDLHVIL